MKTTALALAAATALGFVATPASAAVTVYSSSFIAAPTNTNDFETLTYGFPGNTVYSRGGIDVQYVGSVSIWNTYAYVGNSGWYGNGGGTGYTRISLSNGSAFNAIQFLAGHGWGGLKSLQYQLMRAGSQVATGSIANVNGADGAAGLATYGFGGESFDEVRLQVQGSNAPFNPGAYEALALDNIQIGSDSAVPEPATWAMMIAGFGIIAAAMRRTKTVLRFA